MTSTELQSEGSVHGVGRMRMPAQVYEDILGNVGLHCVR